MSDTPPYGARRICDHDAAAASLATFRASMTDLVVGDDIGPDGKPDGTLLYGRCKGCGSTRAIPICEVRASVVAHGEIDLAAMDAHAKEVIR